MVQGPLRIRSGEAGRPDAVWSVEYGEHGEGGLG